MLSKDLENRVVVTYHLGSLLEPFCSLLRVLIFLILGQGGRDLILNIFNVAGASYESLLLYIEAPVLLEVVSHVDKRFTRSPRANYYETDGQLSGLCPVRFMVDCD